MKIMIRTYSRMPIIRWMPPQIERLIINQQKMDGQNLSHMTMPQCILNRIYSNHESLKFLGRHMSKKRGALSFPPASPSGPAERGFQGYQRIWAWTS